MPTKNYWSNHLKASAVLNPIDRISEVLFGLIMVLTFTCTISVTTADRKEISELLWAALGCNLAWGLVDAIMYLMNLLAERGHSAQVLKMIQKSGQVQESREILRNEITPLAAGILTDDELDRYNERLRKLPEIQNQSLLVARDYLVAGKIALLVFICTFPVALPFAFFTEVEQAMRISNGVALVMLFAGGYKMAKYAGFRPVVTAFAYAMIGVVLVAVTIALGG